MKFSLFKRAQHKKFHHVPIYYDERKEKLKDIEDRAKAELGQETDSTYQDRIKGSMRRYETNHRTMASMADKEKKRSNIRIIVILGILFLVAYLLWTHTDTFIEAFIKS